jgi:hypothetical protein
VGNLAVVTTYFNPCGYRSRRSNYEAFNEVCRKGGAELFTIECVFPEHQRFDLDPDPRVIQLRASSVLWQKERLINHLVGSFIPVKFSKIAWIDCDLIFDNTNWVTEASKMLDLHRVIQLFDHVDRLPRGGGVEDSIGDRYRSFAGVWNDPQTILRDGWDNHGHTGYAWAARRELFEQIGLYEAAILGNGDDLMAHGFVGELHSDCIMANYDQDQAMFRHYQKWAQKAFRYCQGDLGCMPGTVFHLWHGDHENRRYMERQNEMRKIGFDPFVDITIDEVGCLRWASDHPKLHQFVRDYFALRKEDG